MRYALLMQYAEASEMGLGEDRIAAGRAAFDGYARSLTAAGVLVSADVLQPVAAATTIAVRDGVRQAHEGLSADEKEPLGGIVIVDVPDADAALEWAEKCPAAQWGAVVVRPCAVYVHEGRWLSAEL